MGSGGARTLGFFENSVDLFLKASLFEKAMIDLRPAGLSFARWRRAISVSPLNHDQINSGLDI